MMWRRDRPRSLMSSPTMPLDLVAITIWSRRAGQGGARVWPGGVTAGGGGGGAAGGGGAPGGGPPRGGGGGGGEPIEANGYDRRRKDASARLPPTHRAAHGEGGRRRSPSRSSGRRPAACWHIEPGSRAAWCASRFLR